MNTSALIAQCRREFMDQPKSVRVSKQGDGNINLFNVGRFPIVEGSYIIYQGTSAQTEGSGAGKYTLDLDNGDLRFGTTPSNGIEIKSQHKYAHWRDKHWLEAINQAISDLNGRGFFRQTVRQTFIISAGIRSFSGPSACIDVYELLYGPSSGVASRLPCNWSYQQDANKIILGNVFSSKTSGFRSYLRNLQPCGSTTATVDSLDDWLEMIKKHAGANFYRSLAGKIAKEGNANIDEGHFSFTNLRAMANDLYTDFEKMAIRKKPTRPPKEIQNYNPNGGVA